jgi:hypothetical protein
MTSQGKSLYAGNLSWTLPVLAVAISEYGRVVLDPIGGIVLDQE